MDASEPLPIASAIPLLPRPPDCRIPLIPAQQRSWNALARNGYRSARAIASATRLLGHLDTELLRACIDSLVHRHESLRTRIVMADGVLVQRIDADRKCELDFLDLAQTPPESALRCARSAAEELVEQPLDLSSGPLFKPLLVRLSPAEHLLALTTDHMISDARSLEILNREIWESYDQRRQQVSAAPSAARLQFADYAVWQEQMCAEWMTRHAGYWQEHLHNAPAASIPTDFQSRAEKLEAAAISHIPFGKRLTVELRRFAETSRIRLPLLVLAAYLCAMSRWCGERDLLLKFLSHGRHVCPELKTMVGFLASSLYFRVRIADSQRYADLIEAVRLEFESAFRHYDFNRVPDLVPGCSTDLCFNWVASNATSERAGERAAAVPELQMQRVQLGRPWLGKLWLFFSDTPAGINATAAYCADLFAPSTIDRFARSLRSFAQALVQDPQSPVGSLPKGCGQ